VRTIIEVDCNTQPTRLRMYIHNAPHRRAHRAMLKQYRVELWSAWRAAGRVDTILTDIDLVVTFINPTGPDLDNLLTALFQALDGKTGKGFTILSDDRLISRVEMSLLRS
jgi:hypothetical protein